MASGEEGGNIMRAEEDEEEEDEEEELLNAHVLCSLHSQWVRLQFLDQSWQYCYSRYAV